MPASLDLPTSAKENITSSNASPLDVFQTAACISELLDVSSAAVGTAQRLNANSKRSVQQESEVKGVVEEVLNSLKDTESLRQRLVYTSDARDLARVAESALEATTSVSTGIANSHAPSPRPLRKAFAGRSRPTCGPDELEKLSKQLQKIRQRFNRQLSNIVNDANQYNLARLFQQFEHAGNQSEEAIGTPSQVVKEQLDSAIGSNDESVSTTEILRKLDREGQLFVRRKNMLRSLTFNEMHSRRERIHDVSMQSSIYNWIFRSEQVQKDTSQTPPVCFRQWLHSGSGIYWITGKAGSGKSTLMTFISRHPVTPLPSGPMGQRTKAVCWVSLLLVPRHANAKIVRRPFAVHRIRYPLSVSVPDSASIGAQMGRLSLSLWFSRKTQQPRTMNELRNCITYFFENKTWQARSLMCFCFFIDGLDEYDGEHDDVIKLLQDLASVDKIKICASSRPWEIFQQCFASSVVKQYALTLHLHTREDIEQVIRSELEQFFPKRKADISGVKAEMEELVNEMVEKAQGVFLWVYLVIKKEILPGLRYADDLATLRKRLHNLPEGLHEYFSLIFSRIDTMYRKDTAKLFLVCQHASGPLPLPAFDIILATRPQEMAFEVPVDNAQGWNNRSALETVRARVKARCQDLLAVEPSFARKSKLFPSHQIEFLHRSVKDFLEESTINSESLCMGWRPL